MRGMLQDIYNIPGLKKGPEMQVFDDKRLYGRFEFGERMETMFVSSMPQQLIIFADYLLNFSLNTSRAINRRLIPLI